MNSRGSYQLIHPCCLVRIFSVPSCTLKETLILKVTNDPDQICKSAVWDGTLLPAYVIRDPFVNTEHHL